MNLYEQIYSLVRSIPAGRVATYGQIAALVGSPRGARLVGMALRALPAGSTVPWQRVINSKGEISIENLDHPAEEQANMLMAEGVTVSNSNGVFVIDLKQYLWQPTDALTKAQPSSIV